MPSIFSRIRLSHGLRQRKRSAGARLFMRPLITALMALIIVAGAGCAEMAERSMLIGVWNEIPSDPMEHETASIELEFTWGHFYVTRLVSRIENYRDYWGTYRVVPNQPELEFSIDSGSNVPAHSSGKGIYRFDGRGRLILQGFDFGFDGNDQDCARARVFTRDTN